MYNRCAAGGDGSGGEQTAPMHDAGEFQIGDYPSLTGLGDRQRAILPAHALMSPV